MVVVGCLLYLLYQLFIEINTGHHHFDMRPVFDKLAHRILRVYPHLLHPILAECLGDFQGADPEAAAIPWEVRSHYEKFTFRILLGNVADHFVYLWQLCDRIFTLVDWVHKPCYLHLQVFFSGNFVEFVLKEGYGKENLLFCASQAGLNPGVNINDQILQIPHPHCFLLVLGPSNDAAVF